MIRTVHATLHRFANEVRGSLTVEAVVMLPILFWAMLSMLVFFDAYRQSTINVKAALTLSDMISREVEPINGAYLDGAVGMFQELARSETAPKLRVTVIRYDEVTALFYQEWSQQRGGVPVLTDGEIHLMTDRLPVVWNNERLIIVETWSDYKPPFNVGIDQQDLYNFVFTRPRFAPQVKFEAEAGV
jgi:hypothetical protein